MPEWKKKIKELADDFCLSQVKVNRMLKIIENNYLAIQTPRHYKGNRNEYLYDVAQRKLKAMILNV